MQFGPGGQRDHRVQTLFSVVCVSGYFPIAIAAPGSALHSSRSTLVPLILKDTMRVDLVELLAQSPDLDDRSRPPGHRLIGVVSDLGSDLKSTQQHIPRSCAAGYLRTSSSE